MRNLSVPSFRTPPRLEGADRTLRRSTEGAVVSVQTHGRPWVAVLADMVEGVVVANGLTGAEATRLRTSLWALLEPELDQEAA